MINISKNIEEKSRTSNFEALRIVCMLFIIAGHLIMFHHVNNPALDQIIRCGVLPFFAVAVNCFILITGWFGINLNYKKLLNLNWKVTFWCILLAVIAIALGVHELELRKDILMLFPVLTKRYWFITIYFVLCLISPFLNKVVSVLNKQEFNRMIIALVILFVIVPTLAALMNFKSITGDCGFGIMNFITLYLLGRYMRLYRNPKRPAMAYFMIYIALLICCGLFQVVFSRIMGFEFTTFNCYDTFFVFSGSVALFCMFTRLNFQNKVINNAAKYCLIVYVIHLHPFIGEWFFVNMVGLKNMIDTEFIISLLVLPILTYAVCCVLEIVRINIMNGFKALLSPFKVSAVE